ncbi:MAG TPA: hypothetical protein VGI39_40290 [Polyangiaceae bacterium]
MDPADTTPKAGTATLPLASDPNGPAGRAPPARLDPTRTAPLPKAREIKGHEGADRLLTALSSYARPYLAEETAESRGQAAASYAGVAHTPAARVPTPPREPPTKLTPSLVLEVHAAKQRPTRETVERALITVKRSVAGAGSPRRGAKLDWRFWGGVATLAALAWCGVGAFAKGKAHPPMPPPSIAPDPPPQTPPLAALPVPPELGTSLLPPDAALPAPSPTASASLPPRSASPRLHAPPTPSAIPIKPTFQVQD